jgi:hypothetical protein
MSYQDLLKDTSQYVENGDYYLLTITDLDPGQSYPLQFRWKKKDGLFTLWSAVRSISAPALGVPSEPTLLSTDVVGGAGFIKVTWGGAVQSGSVIPNLDRVDVHISGSTFGDGTKPAGFFKSSGTQTFAATPGIYIVQLKIISNNNTQSFFSTARTVTVTSVAEPIETPNLPTGISAVAAPFAVAINWNGSYSGADSFLGFKAINIYAVSSDLGSTATSGISESNLVGSLTVNDTTNRINVGLDNLKQALSLSTTADAYTSNIFFYYVSVNRNDVKYGSPTYTRINSSSVNPIKANLVDLASGLISIENLVAGNGSFSSWLRVGSAGGARIELSGTNNFTNGGNTVKKGLTAYSSGSTETLGFDLATGALALKGSLSATSISTSSGKFSVDSNGIMSASDGSFTGTITASGGSIGGITIAADGLQNSGNTFKIDSSGQIRAGSSTGAAVVITPSGGLFHSLDGGANQSGKLTLSPSGTSKIAGWEINTDSISSPSGNIFLYSAGKTGETNLRIQAGSTGAFKVFDDGSVTATNATITGDIYAETGWLGGADGWLIVGPIIQAGTVGILSLGDFGSIVTGTTGHTYSITQLTGEFVIDETYNSVTTNILQTSGVDDGTNGRIFLGASKRQVEVVKSAQVSGTGSTVTDPSIANPLDTTTASVAYRSGGLRNMYTVSNTFNASLYPSAKNGDVLLVYDTTILV